MTETATPEQQLRRQLTTGLPSLTVAEAATLAAITAVATVAWVSLGLAHLGWFSRGALVVSVAVVWIVAVAVVLRWRPPRPRWHRSDALILVIALGAAALFLPGAPYAAADKDPGVYVAHGFAIERQGSNVIPDPILTEVDGYQITTSWGGRYPGMWVDNRTGEDSLPQFYAHYPALLAAAKSVGGARAVFQVNPLAGLLSLLALMLAVRRGFGLLVAVLSGSLLATNMLQVFFAKYTTTEIGSQMLLSGALLAFVTASRLRWYPAAFLGGILTTVMFLNRPDGVLMVGIATGLIASAVAVSRDWRLPAAWGAGMAVPAAHAWYQAYDLNLGYTVGNGVPTDTRTGLALAGLVVGGVVARRLRAPVTDTLRRFERDRDLDLERYLRVGVAVLATLVFLFFGLREFLLSDTTRALSDGRTLQLRDEINLKRLSWFLTVPGIGMAWFGAVVAALTLRRAQAWILLAPGAALTPIYLWESRVVPRLMWWGRRYVPAVLPFLIVLIAIGLAWLLRSSLMRARPGRYVIGALMIFILGSGLNQSLEVARHREFDGSWEFLNALDDVAGGERAVFVFELTPGLFEPSRNYPGPLWFVHDQVTVHLPDGGTQADVDAFAAAFPDLDLFLLTKRPELPAGLDELSYAAPRLVPGSLTFWEEATLERPDEAVTVDQSLYAWGLLGSAPS